jgi:L-lysine 6-transaminase
VLARVTAAEELSIRQIQQAFANNPDDICCIILEPIQGEGGDRQVRPEFLVRLRELADEHDALLVFDEVQTGMGITGHWWAHQAYGVTPDIMAFGKKTQVCGIVVTGRVDNVADNVFHTSSRINSTWGGNLTDMARVTRYMEIMDEEQLVANAATQGEYLHQQLLELASGFDSHVITNVRGLGLMRAFDLPSTVLRNEFLDRMFQNGVLMVGCGQRSARFRPPINISADEIDQGIEAIRTSLRQVL